MIETVDTAPTSIARAATVLLLAYICVVPIGWSPLPFNIQLADVLFPLVLIVTLAARPRLSLAPLDVVVIVFIASAIPSLFAAHDMKQAGVAFAKQAYLALLYLVVAVQADRLVPPARIMRWLAGAAGVVSAVCVMALAAFYLFGIAVPHVGATMPLPYIGQFYRLYGAFPSPEYLVNFFSFTAPFVMLAIITRDHGRRGLWMTTLVALVIAAVCTAGHGITGLVAATAFGAYHLWKRTRPVLAAATIAITLVLILAVNLLLVFAVRQVRVASGRDQQIAAPAYPYAAHDEGGVPTVSVNVAYNVMAYWLLKEVAWSAFLHHPIAGVGIGSFHDETRRAVDEGRIPMDYREHDPHSTWMGRLAETGAIGTVALAALWIGMLMHSIRAMRGRDTALAMALAAALIAIVVNSPNVDVMNFRFLWLGFGTVRGLTLRA